jgi:hypothetical protein
MFLVAIFCTFAQDLSLGPLTFFFLHSLSLPFPSHLAFLFPSS